MDCTAGLRHHGYGVPLGMSRIYLECPADRPVPLVATDIILLRQEPDEEEEEDEDNGKADDDEEEDENDEGYSE